MSVSMKPTELVTPPVRLAFPALFEPRPVFKGADEKKYQAVLLLPPGTNMQPFAAAMKAAMLEEWKEVPKLRPDKQPVRPCVGDYAGFDEGWHFIRVSSKYMPTVVDQRRQEVIDRERVYPGCWVRVHINAFAWSHQTGGKGVSFGLNAVQLVRDDERLDGRKKPEDLFDPIEIEGDGGFDGDDDRSDAGGIESFF